MYWFVHLGVVTELNEWDSYNPGRLDLNLYPFYRRDLDAGRLTRDGAKELLECFWIKFSNQPAPPKVGVTEEQSATYNDFTLINVGGLTPDGADAVNELSYLVLDVIEEMRLPYTGSCVQLSKKNPDRFLLRDARGRPARVRPAVDLQHRRDRAGVPARRKEPDRRALGRPERLRRDQRVRQGELHSHRLHELAEDPRTRPARRRRPEERAPDRTEHGRSAHVRELRSRSSSAFETQLRHFVDIKIEGNGRIERIFAEQMPAPFLSLLVDDCIEKGQDYNGSGSAVQVDVHPGSRNGDDDRLPLGDPRARVRARVPLDGPAPSRPRGGLRGARRRAEPRRARDPVLRQRRRPRRRHRPASLRRVLRCDRRATEHKGRGVPRQPPADHGARLLRREGRRDARTGGAPGSLCPTGSRRRREPTRTGRRP